MNPVRTRAVFEREEFERLAPFAVKSGASRGRLHAEPEHPYRTVFQRDRDRIVHSLAFRRLEYKTQVFVYHEGDHYRNRLTHTLEASQIARTIARSLRLNEELAEAVVLAHDLGHTPFGHAGERILEQLMKEHGGFDHNRQSLRVVDLLEDRYPCWRGLNLSAETREGILKHGCRWEHPVPVPEATAQPCLEAQVADFGDEIAYTNHDLDDGLRSGLLQPETLEGVAIWRDTARAVTRRLGPVPERIHRAQIIVSLINELATDLVETTAERLAAAALSSADDVRAIPQRLVGYSPEIEKRKRELKRFLYRELYNHPRVVGSNQRAEEVVGDLFCAYRNDVRGLPVQVRERIAEDGEARAIADYVAGMTDRFAIEEHRQRLGESL
ncbi:MAG: deoxyguanosinetriphosphate triphosphohydrolase [Myxococcota bacterium]|nr:deoxyguanosinetriphosphate triphosphohydrolase [Deltaproteobacteria bacterium]MCP4239489.1 deoxyguanosinetriphosphate triphosphohydrolase [bacterium]MDP6073667.1 deoxyguanosinetriphosphate triphosphohydrolase [Myxococcota bacterium]MDP6242058.1 deoxyguanosinetriphosphate triphosphohydrolase [Myxococcota bacterium]MDP7074159.1 deoxyguanosinetriphosphate triphosphohydrolase [Myxococcota bacterium]